jgi:hypothetical protein
MPKQYLIICRAGDNSLHKQWIRDASRNFDIYISYFGSIENKYRSDANHYDETKGPKWPILHKIISENAELVQQYDAIWFPDDDLAIDTADINRMFNLFSALQLSLAQPALTTNSHISHHGLMVQDNTLARYVNFIEVMAPIFSKPALQRLGETFAQSHSGWGLDYLWPVLLNYENMAILDATPVIHTRPVGGELYKNNPMNPREDIKKIGTLYPHLNLAPSHQPNKFQIYAVVRVNRTPRLLTRYKGRLSVNSNKKKHAKKALWSPANSS